MGEASVAQTKAKIHLGWFLRNIVRKPQKHAQKAPAPNYGGTGFPTLPPEPRNKVYRLLFIAKKGLVFYFPNNFCLSSVFLRTCRQIHEEGCSIPYGENTPVFERNKYTRAPLWSPSLKEIGYKDMHLFLKFIGPRNLSMEIYDWSLKTRCHHPRHTSIIKKHAVLLMMSTWSAVCTFLIASRS